MKRGDQDDSWEGEPEGRAYLTTATQRPMVVRGGRQVALGRTTGPDEPTPEVNLLAYWHVLVKHRLVIAGAIGLMILLGLLVTLVTTPIYRASTTIQIDRTGSQVMEIQDVNPDEARDAEFYQTQYSLLKSRSLAERVVARENLASNPAFVGQSSGGPLSFVTGLFGRKDTPPTQQNLAANLRRGSTILSQNLKVDPVRGSRLVKVSYESPDPKIAAQVTNSIAENFIGANLDRRFESSAYARKFLEERLATVKAKLEDSEKQLVAYASTQQIINVATPGPTGGAEQTASQSLTASDLLSMNTALGQAKADRIKAEQRWRQAQTSAMSMPEVLASPTISALSQTKAGLMSQYQEKLATYKPDYPDMIRLKAQIDEIDRQITAETGAIKQSIYAAYQVAAKQEASMSGQVQGLKSGVMDLRTRSIQYNILQREVDTNRTLYDGLLQRYKEIGVAGGVGSNNISIVDRAEVPRAPYKPNMMLNLLIAAGVGLLLGVGAAFGLESLDETIKVPEDIEGKLGLPLLGAIPMLDKGVTIEQAMEDPRSAFSEAYYSVRTALQFSTNDGVPRNILVTSARPSEGKSTTSVALAKNFAKLGMSVLLVDGDLRNPSLHRVMRADSSQGLSNYLTGSARLQDLVQTHRPAQPRLHALWTAAAQPGRTAGRPAHPFADRRGPGELRPADHRRSAGHGSGRRPAAGQRRRRHHPGHRGGQHPPGSGQGRPASPRSGPRPPAGRLAVQVQRQERRLRLWLWLRLRLRLRLQLRLRRQETGQEVSPGDATASRHDEGVPAGAKLGLPAREARTQRPRYRPGRRPPGGRRPTRLGLSLPHHGRKPGQGSARQGPGLGAEQRQRPVAHGRDRPPGLGRGLRPPRHRRRPHGRPGFPHPGAGRRQSRGPGPGAEPDDHRRPAAQARRRRPDLANQG